MYPGYRQLLHTAWSERIALHLSSSWTCREQHACM